MTAHELLAELERRGITARTVGDRLRLKPSTGLDEELLEEARRLKPDLMRLLAPSVPTPTECGWCGAALAPYLLNLAGTPALLCVNCKRWTMVGGWA
jgi:hypothetical protein